MRATDSVSFITNLIQPSVPSDYKVIDEVCKRDVYKTSKFVKPDSLWLDIGANIGTFALSVLKHGGNVICYEPCPRNIEKLKTLEPHITIEPKAVSTLSTVEKLYIEKKNEWRHTLFPVKGRTCIDVDTIASKELPKCDGIKIDAEGSELDIIYNLAEYPTYLVFEYDGGRWPKKSTYDNLIKFLSKHYDNIKYKSLASDINFFPNGLIVLCWKS